MEAGWQTVIQRTSTARPSGTSALADSLTEFPAIMLRSMWTAKLAPEAIVGLIAAVLVIVAFLIDRVFRPTSQLLSRAAEPRRLARSLRDLHRGIQLQNFTDALGQPPTRSAANSHLDGWAKGLAVMQSPAGRHTSYAESYYFGNPGNYQTWVLASNAAGAFGGGDFRPLLAAVGATDVATFGAFEVDAPFGGEMPDCWYTRPPIKEFRESTPINTFSESAPHGSPDAQPGPWIDEVRVFMWRPQATGGRRRLAWVLGLSAVLLAIVAVSLWMGWPASL
jgi:hypothetical protein